MRCGFFDKEAAARLLRRELSAIDIGLEDLRRGQEGLRSRVWLHAEQDFSGASSSSRAPPSPPAFVEHLADETLEAKLHPRTLAQLASALPGDAAPLQELLHVHRSLGEGTTLANLSLLPTVDNVGEWTYFSRAIRCILRRSAVWRAKAAAVQRDVLEWHFLQLEQKYWKLRDSGDLRLRRSSGRHATTISFSRWLWSILLALHRKDDVLLDRTARSLLGDYAVLSLNPGCIHRRARLRALPAAPPSAPAA